MWELDHEESWAPKNWCFWIVVLEKTLESPLNCKEIKPVNPKGNQPWIFLRRTDDDSSILWPPDAKTWLIGKDPDVGKDWGWERKGAQRMRWLEGITNSMKMSKFWETVKVRKSGVLQSVESQRVNHSLATKQLSVFLYNCEFISFLLSCLISFLSFVPLCSKVAFSI